MKALVLAGGKGTRLRPLTYAMAKQLVPVANKPILHFAMDSLYKAGLRDFGVIISPETGESIKESLAIWKPADADITYIPQAEPAGLAHAVKIARDYIQNDDFIMYLGDNLINADLKQHIQNFQKPQSNGQRCDASILLAEVPNPSSFGVAELDANGKVLRLVEKPAEPKSNLALVGVYVFTARVFEAINAIQPSPRGELEITDAIQRLVDDKAVVDTHVHRGWWLDTGKKDDLLSANRTVMDDGAADDDYTIAPGTIGTDSTVIGKVSIAPGAKIKNARLIGPVMIGQDCVIEDAFIGPHVSVGDHCNLRDCHVANSVLLENCAIESVRGKIENSLLGKGCRVVKSDRNPEHGQESHQFMLADHSEVQVV